MATYWKLLAGYDAEATTYSECALSGFSSPFSPVEDAKLKGLRMVINRSAASSLINHVQAKLTCATFKPNSIECGGQGSGLQTAPALMSGSNAVLDWQCDQQVRAGVPVTIEMRNRTADTPVTVEVLIYGFFDNGQG